jgi:hypothetical protein
LGDFSKTHLVTRETFLIKMSSCTSITLTSIGFCISKEIFSHFNRMYIQGWMQWTHLCRTLFCIYVNERQIFYYIKKISDVRFHFLQKNATKIFTFPGVDVMITIFCDLGNFRRKKWHLSQKPML